MSQESVEVVRRLYRVLPNVVDGLLDDIVSS